MAFNKQNTSMLITATTTPAILSEADGTRNGLFVLNQGPDIVYIHYGDLVDADIAHGAIPIPANGFYEPYFVGRGQINIFSATTDQDVIVAIG